MKKIILSIMIMLLTTISVSAANPELTVLPSYGAANKQIEVSVEISESDVVGGSFVVGYDKGVLSPVSIKIGDSIGTRTVVQNLNFNRNGVEGVKLSFLAKIEKGEQVPLNKGILCTITFDVLISYEKNSTVYIADAELIDLDKQTLEYISKSGDVSLNKVAYNAVFTKDGEKTDKLSDSGMELNLGVFNGSEIFEKSVVYVAQYSDSGKMVAIRKIELSLKAGDEMKDTVAIDVDGRTETMKVLCWDDTTNPYAGFFEIGR